MGTNLNLKYISSEDSRFWSLMVTPSKTDSFHVVFLTKPTERQLRKAKREIYREVRQAGGIY